VEFHLADILQQRRKYVPKTIPTHCSHWIPGTEFLINASVNDGSLFISSFNQSDILGNLIGGSENDPFVQIAVQQSGEDEFLVACGSKGGSVGLWEIDVGDLVVGNPSVVPSIRSFASWQVSLEPVALRAIDSQSVFVSTIAGELIRMNDVSGFKPFPKWEKWENVFCRSGDWAPDGSYAVVGALEGIYRIGASEIENKSMLPMSSSETLRIRIQDLLPDQPTPVFPLQSKTADQLKAGYVPAIAFSPDGKNLASVLGEGIAIWTEKGDQFLTRHVPIMDTRFKANLSFSPDASRLVWDSDERVLSIAHLNSLNSKVDRFEQPGPGEVWAWSPSGKRLAIGGSYSQIIEIELETMKGTTVVDYGVFSTCLAYNGEDQIVSGQLNGVIRTWDRNSATSKVIKVHTGEVSHIALLDQGRIGISTDVSGNVGVWFAKEAEPLGWITQKSPAAHNGTSMTPKLWTDYKSVVKLLYNSQH